MSTITLKCFLKNTIHSDDSNDCNNSHDSNEKNLLKEIRMKCINLYLKNRET